MDNKIFDLRNLIVQSYLGLLLKDKTTRRNIIFATDSYTYLGEDFLAEKEITRRHLSEIDLRPRVLKTLEEQSQRTRKKAEVFTPSWLCCKMNNHCDDEWFGRTDVFNHLAGNSWTTTKEKIEFPKGKTWEKYVDSKRLEITCGEAPYIVSRYDTTSGEFIEIDNRIGILDRKLRVVNENTKEYEEWMKWVLRAFQSVYGYEWQGDSLLIARINILLTFIEYYNNRWGDIPSDRAFYKFLSTIVNVIVWNFWQMDGLTGTPPYGALTEESDMSSQQGLFDNGKEFSLIPDDLETDDTLFCKIYDWRTKCSITYSSLRKDKK